MPSGAKKRRALKKKKQQEAIRNITKTQGTNGDNLHGTEEHGSRDGRESDSSLSSPGSQGSEEFGAKVSFPSQSSDMVKDAAKEISGDTDVTPGLGPQSGNAVMVELGTNFQKNIVGQSTNSSSENSTLPAKNGACGNSVAEITPVVDSIKPVVSLPKAVISEKSEHVKTSKNSNLVSSEENEEYYLSPGLENKDSKLVTPTSAAETSKKVESITKSEVPVSSEENRLLLPGPPVVRRTSWLSCCGLFDVMTGSDR